MKVLMAGIALGVLFAVMSVTIVATSWPFFYEGISSWLGYEPRRLMDNLWILKVVGIYGFLIGFLIPPLVHFHKVDTQAKRHGRIT